MTILVTGASGGLGRAFIPLLKARYNERIVGTERTISSDQEDVVHCDFTNAGDVRQLISATKPRIVFHFVGSFTGTFNTDFLVNVHSAQHLFESVEAEGLSTRIVVTGSAAEYGAVALADNPIREDFQGRPVSIYGLTKAMQTDVALFYAKTRNLDIVVARIFNLAIEGLSPRLFFGRATSMISSYKRGEINHLEFGNLEAKRDYVGITQATAQLLAIAESGARGEIYNVGSGIAQSMRNILRDLLAAEGIPNVNVVEENKAIVKSKGFDVPVIYADITKVSGLLNRESTPRGGNDGLVSAD
jgi:nucleoside-diphosphate-sugar epimerase